MILCNQLVRLIIFLVNDNNITNLNCQSQPRWPTDSLRLVMEGFQFLVSFVLLCKCRFYWIEISQCLSHQTTLRQEHCGDWLLDVQLPDLALCWSPLKPSVYLHCILAIQQHLHSKLALSYPSCWTCNRTRLCGRLSDHQPHWQSCSHTATTQTAGREQVAGRDHATNHSILIPFHKRNHPSTTFPPACIALQREGCPQRSTANIGTEGSQRCLTKNSTLAFKRRHFQSESNLTCFNITQSTALRKTDSYQYGQAYTRYLLALHTFYPSPASNQGWHLLEAWGVLENVLLLLALLHIQLRNSLLSYKFVSCASLAPDV